MESIGMRSKRRPKNSWVLEVLNDSKKVKVKNGHTSSKTEKRAMNWCIRAKPTRGCGGSSNSSNRRRRRRGEKEQEERGEE